MHPSTFERLLLRVILLVILFWGVSAPLLASEELASEELASEKLASTRGAPPDLTAGTPNSYLEQAENFRRAGNTRQEQLTLTKALHIWPNSEPLRYQYALHLVRRKNLSQALVQTTYTLGRNPNQPTSANLHLLLLGKLHRHAEGARWVGNLLRINQATPPLKRWSAEWLERFRPLLQVGRTHAKIAHDRQTLTLIDDALGRS